MQEAQKHRDVFEVYLAMGPDRSLQKLLASWATLVPEWAAGEKPPSLNTLKNWSSWFSWQERIMLREKAIAEGVEKKLIKEEINIRASAIKNVRKTVEVLKGTLSSAFTHGVDGKIALKDSVQIKNASELKGVAYAIIHGEEVLQRIIEPEEKVKLSGELKAIIEVRYEDKDEDKDESENGD